MYIYLPLVEMSFHLFLLIGMGGVVGFLSGLFGVGGGFLLTPLMLIIGIPPAYAVASSSNQIVAAAASGAIAHYRMGNVDGKMSGIIIVGSLIGGSLGVHVVKLLRESGNFDVVLQAMYILVLGGIGCLMFLESVKTYRRKQDRVFIQKGTTIPQKISMAFASFPFQIYFKSLGMELSVFVPCIVGVIIGFLSALMGIGGSFIMVPILIYLIGMPTVMAIGTDLLHVVVSSANITIQQAVRNHTVDIMLALCLFCGVVLGAQIGMRSGRFLRGDLIRGFMSLFVLIMMVILFVDLIMTGNADIIIRPGN